MHPRFDWVVFDASGTLIDPRPSAADVYFQLGSKHGSQRTYAEIRARFPLAFAEAFGRPAQPQAGPPTDEAVEKARWKRIVQLSLDDLTAAQLDTAFDELWDHFAKPSSWHLYPDVMPAIQLARSLGLRTAVASNFDQRLPPIFRALAGENAVDQVMLSAELGWSKPDPRFYDAAARTLGVRDKSRLLMIGDDWLNDVAASQAAGWKSAQITRSEGACLRALVEQLVEI